MYGKSNMETYITICKIDSQWEFSVWLRKLKLWINLEGWVGRQMGRRFKREGIYVYLWLIHVEVWQKTTKFCKAIILQLKKKDKMAKRVNFMLLCYPVRHDGHITPMGVTQLSAINSERDQPQLQSITRQPNSMTIWWGCVSIYLFRPSSSQL